MRKELLLILLVFLFAGAATLRAQSSKVKVVRADGSATEMGAGTVQRIEIGAGAVTIVPVSGESQTVNLTDLKGLCFGTFVFSGIGQVISNEMKVWPVTATDRLHVSGVPAGTSVVLYNSNGAKAAECKSDGSTTTFRVGNLPDGVYVVKVGGYATKFIKK